MMMCSGCELRRGVKEMPLHNMTDETCLCIFFLKFQHCGDNFAQGTLEILVKTRHLNS